MIEIIPGVNDRPRPATAVLASNGSDLVARHNALVTKLGTFESRLAAIEPAEGLIMLFEGPNDAVDLLPSSIGGHAYTLYNGAKLTTSTSKNGNSCLSFPVDASSLEIVPSANNNLTLGRKDFTIEFWRRYLDYDSYLASTLTFNGLLAIDSDGFKCRENENSPLTVLSMGDFATEIGTDWHHFAVTRNKGVFRTFIDGKLKATTTANVSIASPSLITVSGRGLIDSLKILHTCKYIKNFTVLNSYVEDLELLKNSTEIFYWLGTGTSNQYVDPSTNGQCNVNVSSVSDTSTISYLLDRTNGTTFETNDEPNPYIVFDFIDKLILLENIIMSFSGFEIPAQQIDVSIGNTPTGDDLGVAGSIINGVDTLDGSRLVRKDTTNVNRACRYIRISLPNAVDRVISIAFLEFRGKIYSP